MSLIEIPPLLMEPQNLIDLPTSQETQNSNSDIFYTKEVSLQMKLPKSVEIKY